MSAATIANVAEIKYVECFTAWNSNASNIKSISFEEAKKLNSEKLRKLNIGFNEVITAADNAYIRLAGDVDNDDADSIVLMNFMDELLQKLHTLEEKLGKVAIGGYTKCAELKDSYPCLEYIKDGHHSLSLHFAFYESKLSLDTYRSLMDKGNMLFNKSMILS